MDIQKVNKELKDCDQRVPSLNCKINAPNLGGNSISEIQNSFAGTRIFGEGIFQREGFERKENSLTIFGWLHISIRTR